MSKKYLTYQFGCLPPTQGLTLALDQMQRRSRLWNALADVECEYRAAARRILAAADTGIPGAAPAIRRYSSLTPEEKEQLDALELSRRVGVKRVQSESGLFWCNYDDEINNYQRARKQIKGGTGLRYRRWTGAGKVTVRFQYGLSVEKAFADDTRLRLGGVDPKAWSHPSRGVRRKLSRTTVRIRVGSDRRVPLWLELPVVLHRPLPPSGVIRAASVVREIVGGRYRWRLLLIVEQPADEAPRQGPAVAIDLGWRMLDDGLRVAYWEDERGAHGQLLLTRDLLWAFEKINDLRSKQERVLNQARASLAAWAASHDVPEWADLTRLAQWKGPGRFLRLLHAWARNRFEGDNAAFEDLAAFEREYLRLQAWEENLRDQTVRHRRQLYRELVSSLLENRGSVFLEDFDLRNVARKAAATEGKSAFRAAMRVVACPSLLRRCFEEKGGCHKVDGRYTTQDCSWCGCADPWDAVRTVMHQCAGCGRWFDQDRNAARNLLQRGLALTPVNA